MMLVWAKGMLFAKINGLPFVTSSWWGLHWGALLRRENKSRLYMGYFKETGITQRVFIKWQLLFYKIIREPQVSLIQEVNNQKTIFLFNQVITHQDLFGELRPYQSLISRELYGILTLQMRNQLKKYAAPVVGVHIRRGDFKLGNQTTALDFFSKAIKLIRESVNEIVPVTVFTDADPSEISELAELPGIEMAAPKPDILDILLLSKSQIIITSRSSTFSYWAAFLSDALVIRPHNDWQEKIKFAGEGENYCEIKWDEMNKNGTENLVRALKARKISS